jgi:hypothetical protein
MLGKIIAFGVILLLGYVSGRASSTNRPSAQSERIERSHINSARLNRNQEKKRSLVSRFDEKVGRSLRKATTKWVVKKVSKVLCRQKNNNIKIDYHKTKGNSNKKQSFIPKIQLKRL